MMYGKMWRIVVAVALGAVSQAALAGDGGQAPNGDWLWANNPSVPVYTGPFAFTVSDGDVINIDGVSSTGGYVDGANMSLAHVFRFAQSGAVNNATINISNMHIENGRLGSLWFAGLRNTTINIRNCRFGETHINGEAVNGWHNAIIFYDCDNCVIEVYGNKAEEVDGFLRMDACSGARLYVKKNWIGNLRAHAPGGTGATRNIGFIQLWYGAITGEISDNIAYRPDSTSDGEDFFSINAGKGTESEPFLFTRNRMWGFAPADDSNTSACFQMGDGGGQTQYLWVMDNTIIDFNTPYQLSAGHDGKYINNKAYTSEQFPAGPPGGTILQVQRFKVRPGNMYNNEIRNNNHLCFVDLQDGNGTVPGWIYYPSYGSDYQKQNLDDDKKLEPNHGTCDVDTYTSPEGLTGCYDKSTITNIKQTPIDGWSENNWNQQQFANGAGKTLLWRPEWNQFTYAGPDGLTSAIDYSSPWEPGGGAQYALSVTKAGAGTGSVTLDPAGGVYNPGTLVTLTAVAGAGSVFTGWSGDASGTSNTTAVTMSADMTVVATFGIDPDVPDAFPVDLRGATPESATVALNVSKPAGAVGATLTLTTFDADIADEGELVINGNAPIGLFGVSGVGANNEIWVEITLSTPVSYWNDGGNTLVFRHLSTQGYVIDGATATFDVAPDHDGDGIPDSVDPDDDNDGMPDVWEETCGLDPLVPDADGDPDCDGMTNIEEYIAGTHPQVSSSRFAIDSVKWANPGASLSFSSVTGRWYGVEYCDDRVVTNWLDLTNNVPGTGGTLIVEDPAFGGTGSGMPGRRFYRIRVSMGTASSPPPAEIMVDNLDPNTSKTGAWTVSSGADPWGGESVYSGDADATFRWIPDIIEPGVYEVYAWWTYHTNRSVTVPYTVAHASGTDTVTVNQQDAALGGQWNLLGAYTFDAGGNGYIEVSAAQGQACADAVRLVYAGGVVAPEATLSAAPAGITAGQSSTLTWTSTNATSCAGTGFSTGGELSGSVIVQPAVTTVYTLTCAGSGGAVTRTATVTVTNGGDTAPNGDWLYANNPPIPTFNSNNPITYSGSGTLTLDGSSGGGLMDGSLGSDGLVPLIKIVGSQPAVTYTTVDISNFDLSNGRECLLFIDALQDCTITIRNCKLGKSNRLGEAKNQVKKAIYFRNCKNCTIRIYGNWFDRPDGCIQVENCDVSDVDIQYNFCNGMVSNGSDTGDWWKELTNFFTGRYGNVTGKIMNNIFYAQDITASMSKLEDIMNLHVSSGTEDNPFLVSRNRLWSGGGGGTAFQIGDKNYNAYVYVDENTVIDHNGMGMFSLGHHHKFINNKGYASEIMPARGIGGYAHQIQRRWDWPGRLHDCESQNNTALWFYDKQDGSLLIEKKLYYPDYGRDSDGMATQPNHGVENEVRPAGLSNNDWSYQAWANGQGKSELWRESWKTPFYAGATGLIPTISLDSPWIGDALVTDIDFDNWPDGTLYKAAQVDADFRAIAVQPNNLGILADGDTADNELMIVAAPGGDPSRGNVLRSLYAAGTTRSRINWRDHFSRANTHLKPVGGATAAVDYPKSSMTDVNSYAPGRPPGRPGEQADLREQDATQRRYDELYLSIDIYLDPNWAPIPYHKLMGLNSGSPSQASHGVLIAPHEEGYYGLTTRLLMTGREWDATGARGSDGSVAMYLYETDRAQQTLFLNRNDPTNIKRDNMSAADYYIPPKGTWWTAEIHSRLNDADMDYTTIGHTSPVTVTTGTDVFYPDGFRADYPTSGDLPNGVLEVWITDPRPSAQGGTDGAPKLMLQKTDVMQRWWPYLKYSHATFKDWNNYNEGTSQYLPTEDQYIYFDRFRVDDERINSSSR